ncbi:hypothetical protein HID58_011682, partial [Brassica napus]
MSTTMERPGCSSDSGTQRHPTRLLKRPPSLNINHRSTNRRLRTRRKLLLRRLHRFSRRGSIRRRRFVMSHHRRLFHRLY